MQLTLEERTALERLQEIADIMRHEKSAYLRSHVETLRKAAEVLRFCHADDAIIAAAPELLEACEHALEVVLHPSLTGRESAAYWLRAAIANARLGTPEIPAKKIVVEELR